MPCVELAGGGTKIKNNACQFSNIQRLEEERIFPIVSIMEGIKSLVF
jgi:hypothetical protein